MKTSGAFPCNQVILPEWSNVGYVWKRSPLWVRWSKSEETLCTVQAIDNYGGRDYWYKVLTRRSEERICWGREFQMESEAKENDLRPISDRISGTIRRFLLEDLRDRGGMYGKIKSWMYAGCWNFKTKYGNLKFNTEGNRQPMKLVKHWRNMIRSLCWWIHCASKGILNHLEAIYGRFW